MKLGLFGGSFDPVHRGHVATAHRARRELGLDRVLFLPTAKPPHKRERDFAPAFRRFVMVELALLEVEGLYASPRELTPGRVAYTVDTLEAIREEMPEAELSLLMGSDSLAQLHTWRRWREILGLVSLVILARPGWDVSQVRRELPAELVELLFTGPAGGARFTWVECSFELSSTEIRTVLRQGASPPEEAVDPLVLDYIHKYRLYR